MGGSRNRGPLIQSQILYVPYYSSPQIGTPNFEKPPFGVSAQGPLAVALFTLHVRPINRLSSKRPESEGAKKQSSEGVSYEPPVWALTFFKGI